LLTGESDDGITVMPIHLYLLFDGRANISPPVPLFMKSRRRTPETKHELAELVATFVRFTTS
jgi:hypothetical protein